jgi:Fe-Mn family superoxide dismutase
MSPSPSLRRGIGARRQEEENMAKYTLPDLPYDYAALEPHISGKIMELHHSKHHQAYVTGANTAIDEFFGGFDKFQAHFTAAATGIQGSGWAVLSWDPIGEQLIIQQLFDQQSNTAQGTVPIFQLDMWEHAFYLDYLNVKADYVKAVWNIANWQNVAQRLDAARQKTSGLLVLS